MKTHLSVSIGLVAMLTLNNACGDNADTSGLDASVSQKIEDKWGDKVDLSKEIELDPLFFADQMTAIKSSLKNLTLGANLSASLQFASTVVFDIGGGMSFTELFNRNMLHQVNVLRMRDVDGKEDGRGLFVDADTVAAHRLIQCSSQKVITQGSEMGPKANVGISFLGLNLSGRVDSGLKMQSSTDYTMKRGYYETKTDVRLNDIFAICDDIAKTDAALMNIDHISKVVKLDFAAESDLEAIAYEVASGKKVRNFKYQNLKFDFQLEHKGSDTVTFEATPEAHFIDPRIEVTVHYTKVGDRVVIQGVDQACKSNCSSYKDENGLHGLYGKGEHATTAQVASAIKLMSSIFAATALGSK